MAKKKIDTYGDISRKIQGMLEQLKEARGKMANVMIKAFVTDEICEKLGDYNDADLSRIMILLSNHVDECVVQLESEKAEKHRSKNAKKESYSENKVWNANRLLDSLADE